MEVDHLWLDCHAATFAGTGMDCARIEDAAIAWSGDTLVYVGPRTGLPADLRARHTTRCDGAWVTPGLIDCHTHAVFAGDRADEFALRLAGASYADIAYAGGGILGSVRKTAAASVEELTAGAARRLAMLARDGVTTVEIKSGYGLTLDAERRMLQAARAAGRRAGMQVCTTFLGLHALPAHARAPAQRAAFVAEVANSWLPTLHSEGLVDAVDAFCEGIGFSAAECAELFASARRLGVPVKLHADQLSDSAGAALAAEYRALSADHVEYSSPAGIAAMAAAGTVAVLLPGAFVLLGETQRPPVAGFRAAGVAMAVASDLNPGTSPLLSLRLAGCLACSVFGLTPAEALAAMTVHAARALGLADRGRLLPGLRADLALWRVDRLDALCYWLGGDWLGARVCGGRLG